MKGRCGSTLGGGWLLLTITATTISLLATESCSTHREQVAQVELTSHSGNGREVKTIAVLPFRSDNTSDLDEYLGPAMSDAIANRLMRVPDLIIRPTSVVAYRGIETMSPAEAGKVLMVDGVLEGVLHRRGESIRVDLRFFRCSDGEMLWKGSLESRPGDLMNLEGMIAWRVLPVVGVTPDPSEIEQIESPITRNPAAYRAYLKGRYEWTQRTRFSLQKAIESLEQAVDLDPRCDQAHLALAECFVAGSRLETRPPAESLALAKLAVSRALQLNGGLGSAYAIRGYVRMQYDWDWDGAEEDFKHAIDINPNLSGPFHWYSEFLSAVGRDDEAVSVIVKAEQLDPSSLLLLCDRAMKYYFTRQFDQAEGILRHAIGRDYASAPAHRNLGLVFLQQGRYQKAVAEFQSAMSFAATQTTAALLARAYALKGDQEQATRMLANLVETSRLRYASPYGLAIIYAALDDHENMYTWLDKAMIQRALPPVFFKADPLWDRFRQDPRFERLVERCRFPNTSGQFEKSKTRDLQHRAARSRVISLFCVY